MNKVMMYIGYAVVYFWSLVIVLVAIFGGEYSIKVKINWETIKLIPEIIHNIFK